MSDSVQPHRRQPTRLPCPWDSPGKNTGVGCHFLLQCMKVKSESEVAQSCLTLSDPMDCSPPGSSIHGISRQEYWSGMLLPSPTTDGASLQIQLRFICLLSFHEWNPSVDVLSFSGSSSVSPTPKGHSCSLLCSIPLQSYITISLFILWMDIIGVFHIQGCFLATLLWRL